MKGACGPLSSLLLALPLLSLVLVLLSLLYSLLLFCAAVACSGLPHKRERAPRARDFLTTSLYLSGRACGRFLLLFLVLFLVTSVLSLVLVLAPPAVRCRCALETSSHPRGGAAGSRQPRNLVFFFFGGSGREGALANAPRRERFSTIKDGRCWSWCLLVSLLYSLLLLCAAVACSGLPDNRDGAPRARDNLATSCFFWLWPRRGARQRTSTGTLLDEKRRRALVAPSW